MGVRKLNGVVADGNRLELDVVITVAGIKLGVVGVIEILPIRKLIDEPTDQ